MPIQTRFYSALPRHRGPRAVGIAASRSSTGRPSGRRTKLVALAAIALMTAFLLPVSTSGAAVAPVLGTADSFAVLAHTTVTNTGPTVVSGDLGVSPGNAVTGFTTSVPPGPGIVNGVTHVNDAVAAQAGIDAEAAYATSPASPAPAATT